MDIIGRTDFLLENWSVQKTLEDMDKGGIVFRHEAQSRTQTYGQPLRSGAPSWSNVGCRLRPIFRAILVLTRNVEPNRRALSVHSPGAVPRVW